MLEVVDLRASYGRAEVLRGVSFEVGAGEVVAVVGDNGAGKSTLARAVCGVHRATSGTVRLDGRDLRGCSTVEVARAGVNLVPQGRRLFGSLTVAEHIAVARLHSRQRALPPAQLLEVFPRLQERSRVRARSLSGGEQQMLAITRAVLLGPDVLVLDEPTEGLAPAVVELVATLVGRLRQAGVAVLLLEQNGWFPNEISDRVLSIERGVILSRANGEEVRHDCVVGCADHAVEQLARSWSSSVGASPARSTSSGSRTRCSRATPTRFSAPSPRPAAASAPESRTPWATTRSRSRRRPRRSGSSSRRDARWSSAWEPGARWSAACSAATGPSPRWPRPSELIRGLWRGDSVELDQFPVLGVAFGFREGAVAKLTYAVPRPASIVVAGVGPKILAVAGAAR